ncbi:cbb3-type cytochrome oxidase subunit 3 [Roseateles saccharophilus]|jgi:cytochrome c oxidase cbb3-type subunit 4|uniref:Cytochrome c oxidase cbb3-type subunit 4 n=1 Tax=Roseateles saccharophilus TaxID=304 RepID=A0A4R3VJF5_ROSSA|nr:cbb3-type cytochrome c oxidase subunit 3 [Roseateles saccharophilus]MDG0832497.1 CcoQ/FixQ family Cbb3-type cytochrome c oxidase assembly chaperone [Roseateles saccharophilus]TCV03958.1 cytochrome c oxidase cbb3-type subunit 4 [Roseateles saccharophilus]
MGINELRVAVTVVSLAVFLGIVVWAWRGRFDDAATLPLQGDDQ